MSNLLTALPLGTHSVFYAYTIQIRGEEVASFEKFSERSTRTVERVRQIYFSQGARPAELVWGGTDYTLELTHVEWYTQSLLKAVGVIFPALEYMNFRIDVSEIKRIPSGTLPSGNSPDQGVSYATQTLTFKDCVVSDYTKDVDTGTARVMESMTVQGRYVTYSQAGS